VAVSQIGPLEHLASNKNIDIQAESTDKPLSFAKKDGTVDKVKLATAADPIRNRQASH
jgi:hypothetical protein